MNGAQIAGQFLALAIKAERLGEPPRNSEVIDALSALDRMAVQLGRLIVAGEKPLSLHGAARALYSMTQQFDRYAPDTDATEACVRVATRALVAAHQLQRAATPAPKEFPDETTP